MKTTIIRATVLAATILFGVGSAHAVNFDFVAYAAGNEHAAVSETVTSGSVSVTASGYDLVTNATYLAYFDDLSGGNPGGLGVCKTLFPAGECLEPPSDDNIGMNEVLKLVFSEEVSLTDILFSNGNHDDIYLGNFGVLIDAVPVNVGSFTQYLAAASFAGPLVGTTFYFISNATISGIDNDLLRQFYISGFNATPTSVPEPISLSLLGLGVIGAVARRKIAL